MDGDEDHWKAVAARMAREDEAAAGEFARYFGARLRGFFLRKGFDRTDAEDLAAMSIARAVSRIGLYRPQEGSSFSAWVHTIAWRARADWLRAHVATEPLPDDLPASGPAVESADADPALVEAVNGAMARLSPKARQIICQRYLSGEISFVEIGQALGMSAGAVRVQHFRALARLGKILRRDPRVRARRRSKHPRRKPESKSR